MLKKQWLELTIIGLVVIAIISLPFINNFLEDKATAEDSFSDPVFGRYMTELQSRIKQNWHPPKSFKDQDVVALFHIDRKGRLLDVTITKSSGNVDVDESAQAAIRSSAPFKPLPASSTEPDIAVEFTFDYNVYKTSPWWQVHIQHV